MAVDGDGERETEASGVGSRNEDKDGWCGLGFEESWANPKEEPLEGKVLSTGGMEYEKGGKDPGGRPRVSCCSGPKVEPDLEPNNNNQGDECRDITMSPLV